MECKKNIQGYGSEIENVLEPVDFIRINQLVNDFLIKKVQITNDEIISNLNDRMQSINSAL
jgi:DNA-binding protein